MLTYELLNKRLDQVEQQRQTLSAQNKLMLLTLSAPDLSSGSFKRIFTVSLPVEWGFLYGDVMEITCSKRLISIILEDLIPAYASPSLRYHWYEQCLAYQLTHLNRKTTQQQIDTYIDRLEECPNNPRKTALFKKFKELIPSINNALILTHDYKSNQLWSEAIIEYKWILVHSSKLAADDFLDYMECLLHRNRLYDSECTDAQMALYLLLNVQAKNERYDYLVDKAICLILPQKIVAKRGEATNIFADMGRGLNHFSKSIGNTFGGRESEIPYSKGVIASAPTLLTHQEISEYLNQEKLSQQELEKILTDRGVIASIGVSSATYSVGLLWSYSQIDPSVLDALIFSSAGQPEYFSTLQDIAGTTLESSGAMTRLSGYIAEQQVAFNLVQQGHTVAFPDTANQVGYDLLVDGQAIQVKNTLSSDYVLHHIERYPDIPVIVNQELAGQLGGHPNVFVDHALSHANVQQTMQDSLEHIDHFDSLTYKLPIPFITLGMAAYRNYGVFNAGQINSKQYVENIGKETAAIAGGAIAGKVLLGTVGGIVAGPIGIALAGGLGAYIGGVAGSTGANVINRENLCDQRDRVVTLLIDFAKWFKENLLKYRVQQNLAQLRNVQNKLKAQTQHIGLSMIFIAYQYEVYQHAVNLHNWLDERLKGKQSDMVQAGWVALQQSQHFLSTELRQKVAKINDELEKYKCILEPKKSSNEVLVTP